MSAEIHLRDQNYNIHSGQTLLEALIELDIQPESVLAVRDGLIIYSEEIIHPKDIIKLIHVISGGS